MYSSLYTKSEPPQATNCSSRAIAFETLVRVIRPEPHGRHAGPIVVFHWPCEGPGYQTGARGGLYLPRWQRRLRAQGSRGRALELHLPRQPGPPERATLLGGSRPLGPLLANFMLPVVLLAVGEASRRLPETCLYWPSGYLPPL